MNRLPPLALRAAAALLIVFGAASLVRLTVGLFYGPFAWDFNFIGLLIGYGLLRARRAATGCAAALFGFGFFFLALGGLALFFPTPSTPWDSAGLLVLAWAVLAVVTASLFVGLNSHRVDEWEKTARDNSVDSSGWFWPLALAGALTAIGPAIENYRTDVWIRGLYSVRTTFEFHDATTGKPLHSIDFSAPSICASPRHAFAPRISLSIIGAGSKGDAVEMKLDGFAAQPVELSFKSHGMEPYKYTLDRHTPERVLLNLKPTPAKEAQNRK